jgi:hypothetical protein
MITGAPAPGTICRAVRFTGEVEWKKICKMPPAGRQRGVSVLQTDHRENGIHGCHEIAPEFLQSGVAGLHAKCGDETGGTE